MSMNDPNNPPLSHHSFFSEPNQSSISSLSSSTSSYGGNNQHHRVGLNEHQLHHREPLHDDIMDHHRDRAHGGGGGGYSSPSPSYDRDRYLDLQHPNPNQVRQAMRHGMPEDDRQSSISSSQSQSWATPINFDSLGHNRLQDSKNKSPSSMGSSGYYNQGDNDVYMPLSGVPSSSPHSHSHRDDRDRGGDDYRRYVDNPHSQHSQHSHSSSPLPLSSSHPDELIHRGASPGASSYQQQHYREQLITRSSTSTTRTSSSSSSVIHSSSNQYGMPGGSSVSSSYTPSRSLPQHQSSHGHSHSRMSPNPNPGMNVNSPMNPNLNHSTGGGGYINHQGPPSVIAIPIQSRSSFTGHQPPLLPTPGGMPSTLLVNVGGTPQQSPATPPMTPNLYSTSRVTSKFAKLLPVIVHGIIPPPIGSKYSQSRPQVGEEPQIGASGNRIPPVSTWTPEQWPAGRLVYRKDDRYQKLDPQTRQPYNQNDLPQIGQILATKFVRKEAEKPPGRLRCYVVWDGRDAAQECLPNSLFLVATEEQLLHYYPHLRSTSTQLSSIALPSSLAGPLQSLTSKQSIHVNVNVTSPSSIGHQSTGVAVTGGVGLSIPLSKGLLAAQSSPSPAGGSSTLVNSQSTGTLSSSSSISGDDSDDDVNDNDLSRAERRAMNGRLNTRGEIESRGFVKGAWVRMKKKTTGYPQGNGQIIKVGEWIEPGSNKKHPFRVFIKWIDNDFNTPISPAKLKVIKELSPSISSPGGDSSSLSSSTSSSPQLGPSQAPSTGIENVNQGGIVLKSVLSPSQHRTASISSGGVSDTSSNTSFGDDDLGDDNYYRVPVPHQDKPNSGPVVPSTSNNLIPSSPMSSTSASSSSFPSSVVSPSSTMIASSISNGPSNLTSSSGSSSMTVNPMNPPLVNNVPLVSSSSSIPSSTSTSSLSSSPVAPSTPSSMSVVQPSPSPSTSSSSSTVPASSGPINLNQYLPAIKMDLSQPISVLLQSCDCGDPNILKKFEDGGFNIVSDALFLLNHEGELKELIPKLLPRLKFKETLTQLSLAATGNANVNAQQSRGATSTPVAAVAVVNVMAQQQQSILVQSTSTSTNTTTISTSTINTMNAPQSQSQQAPST